MMDNAGFRFSMTLMAGMALLGGLCAVRPLDRIICAAMFVVFEGLKDYLGYEGFGVVAHGKR
jgi:hypothetical protein